MHATATVFYTPDSDDVRYLPEGPAPLDTRWPWPGNWLGWVGIQHGATSEVGSMNFLNLDTRENRHIPLPGRPGFWAETNHAGVLFLGMEREIILLDARGDVPVVVQTGMTIHQNPRTIINDGLATPFGAVFGTKDLRFEEGLGHLYLYRNGASELATLRGDQVCSNGKIAWQEESEWVLLDIDSPTRKIVKYRMDVAAGTLTPPETLVDFNHEAHVPDGMRPTPDGNSLVVAFYNPEDVAHGIARQINIATGETEFEWHTPGAPRVTCPAFVEHEGRVKLMLTTAHEGAPPEIRANQPHAGALFLGDTSFSTPLNPRFQVNVDRWITP